MPETLCIEENSSKQDKYTALLPQLQSLTEDEPNLYANLANVAAALKETFKFFWVGFYLVDPKSNGQELVLGPFQVIIQKNFNYFNIQICFLFLCMNI